MSQGHTGPLPRLLVCLSCFFFVVALLAVGCGRSDLGLEANPDGSVLPDGTTDGGPDVNPDGRFDGASCNPANCPSGCCDASGVCQLGTSNGACGTGGASCTTCTNGASCDPQTHTCTTVGQCNALTCPNGCCDSSGNCQPGTQLNACGSAGIACEDCAANGFDRCVPDPMTGQNICVKRVRNCDPNSCPNGCCTFGPGGNSVCVDGRENTTCGIGGASCQNCANQGEICDPNAHTCVVPTCGPSNCSGCCLGNVCQPGTSPSACGQGGGQCFDCGPNAACVMGICETNIMCGPNNCGGCCAGNSCLPGSDNMNCGEFGQQCFPCPPGFQCTGGICQTMFDAGACGPNNCPGCCQGNACLPGNNPFACGAGGQQCFPCPPGDSCQLSPGGAICVPSTCGPGNCMGCCDAMGNCQPGDNGNACGFGGQMCFACPPGATCSGGFCQINIDGGGCGPGNCNGCCDATGTCQPGSANGACGVGGQACTICPGNSTCTMGICQGTTCNAMNCPGCCDVNNICEGGFIDTACGSGGAMCVDCTQTGTTCDDTVIPRVCTNQQMTCPAPYPGCSPGTTTIPPVPMAVCSPTDIANAQQACQLGALSTPCLQFFQTEQIINPACASCLSPFDVRFQDGTGIFLCVAPCEAQIDPMCNQLTGCETDCEDVSCGMCMPGDVETCKTTVNQGGQCSNYYFSAFQCIFQSGLGNCQFCDPRMYMSFGDWLGSVGQNYCGQ